MLGFWNQTVRDPLPRSIRYRVSGEGGPSLREPLSYHAAPPPSESNATLTGNSCSRAAVRGFKRHSPRLPAYPPDLVKYMPAAPHSTTCLRCLQPTSQLTPLTTP